MVRLSLHRGDLCGFLSECLQLRLGPLKVLLLVHQLCAEPVDILLALVSFQLQARAQVLLSISQVPLFVRERADLSVALLLKEFGFFSRGVPLVCGFADSFGELAQLVCVFLSRLAKRNSESLHRLLRLCATSTQDLQFGL